MLHVEFIEILSLCILFIMFSPIVLSFMLHNDFKKWSCHPFEFKGQEPQQLKKTKEKKNQHAGNCYILHPIWSIGVESAFSNLISEIEPQ